MNSKIDDLRRVWVVDDKDSQIEIDGALIGYATSQQDFHSHPENQLPQQGVRCSACRWLEVSIFRVLGESESEGRYLVARSGFSIIPGENVRHNARFTDSEFEVVELLLVRKDDKVTLPGPSARALAAAAAFDPNMRDAYLNRPVV